MFRTSLLNGIIRIILPKGLVLCLGEDDTLVARVIVVVQKFIEELAHLEIYVLIASEAAVADSILSKGFLWVFVIILREEEISVQLALDCGGNHRKQV